MEIFYCKKCHSRVSSVDIESGKGVVSQNEVYCEQCAGKLGVEPDSRVSSSTGTRKAGQKRPSTIRKRSGSSHITPGSSSSRRSAVTSGGREAAGVYGKDRTYALIITAMVIIAVLLLGVIVVVVLKKKGKTAETEKPVQTAHEDEKALDEPGEETDSSGETETAGSQDKTEPVKDVKTEDEKKDKKETITLPEYTEPFFLSQQGIELLTGPQWKRNWKEERGEWVRENNSLKCILSKGQGAGIIESKREWANFEMFVQFAVAAKCSVELQVNRKYSRKGACTIRFPETGKFHEFKISVSGGHVTSLLFNDRELFPQGSGKVTVKSTNMPEKGRVRITFSPAAFGDFKSFCAVGIRKTGGTVSSKRTSEDGEPGWGEPMPLIPFSTGGPWICEGSRPAVEGTKVIFNKGLTDLLLDIKTERFILTGKMKQEFTSTSGRNNISIYFPNTNLKRKSSLAVRNVFFADGTLQFKKPGKTEKVAGSAWRDAEWFSFKIKRYRKEVETFLNGKKVGSTYSFELPNYEGGILFASNRGDDDYIITLDDLKITLPGQKSTSVTGKKDMQTGSSETVSFQQGVEGYSGCIDSFTNNNSPEKPRPDDDELEIELYNRGEVIEKSYILFNISSKIPQESDILSARLTLWCNRENNRHERCVLEKLLSPWKEDITYVDEKQITTEPIETIVPEGFLNSRRKVYDPPRPMHLDITKAVKEWVSDPDSNYGLRLSPVPSKNNFDMQFWSSEYKVEKYRPRLEITFSQGNISEESPSPEQAEPEAVDKAEASGGEVSEPKEGGAGVIVYSQDFDEDLQHGTFGRIAEVSDNMKKSLRARNTGPGSTYEFKASVTLGNPVKVSENMKIRFKLFAKDLNVVHYGIKDMKGTVRGGYTEVGFKQNEWIGFEKQLTHLKTTGGKRIKQGIFIKELVFWGGFKGAGPNGELYVDAIQIVKQR